MRAALVTLSGAKFNPFIRDQRSRIGRMALVLPEAGGPTKIVKRFGYIGPADPVVNTFRSRTPLTAVMADQRRYSFGLGTEAVSAT